MAIAFIAVLVIPEYSRSDYFFIRVIWTEVLNIILWSGVSFSLLTSAASKNHITRFGGISPITLVIASVYAILSFSLMMVHAFAPISDIANQIHWFFQILIFTVAFVLLVFLPLSSSAVITDFAVDVVKSTTPMELHDILLAQEKLLQNELNEHSRELRVSIKQLREIIIYSLHGNEALKEFHDYHDLSDEVKSLSNAIADLNVFGYSDKNTDMYIALRQSAIALTTKSKLIASRQIIR